MILRFPTIARETGGVAGFWDHIEGAMEGIRASAESEGAVEDVEARDEDLVEMANDAGLVRSEVD